MIAVVWDNRTIAGEPVADFQVGDRVEIVGWVMGNDAELLAVYRDDQGYPGLIPAWAIRLQPAIEPVPA